MPKTVHPRAHLNSGGKPPATMLPASPPKSRPALPAPAVKTAPTPKTTGTRMTAVGTKLGPEDMAKLERLRRKAGGPVLATLSATLRWLIQTAEE